MNKETKKTAVPKLRFPEFEKFGPWLSEPMEKLFDFFSTNSFSRDKLNYDGGEVRNIHYGDIHTKFKTLFKLTDEIVPFINASESLERIKPECYCVEGDMVFADASEDLEDIGKSIELIDLNNEKVLPGLHTILARPKEKTFASGFSGYLFKSTPMRSQIQKESQGAKVLGISAKKMAKMRLLFPDNKNEQQKIADCLSSLDNLITAQNDKVDNLKNYKKSLLQQLFPQEGETVPKLRFPQFEKDGSWKHSILDKISNYENGKAHEQEILSSGKYTVANSKFISTDGAIRKFTNTPFCLAKEGEILMVLSDVPNGRAIAKCYYVEKNDDITVNQRICKITSNAIDSRFLFYVLNRNPYFLKFDDGVKQTNLGKDDVLSCPIYFPFEKEEQRKISDLLFSIDSLINNEAAKLDMFKTHKRGLLQQLFPSIVEV